MRGFVRFLIVLIVILAIAYVAAWWYAEGRLAVGFQQSEAALRQAGWTVTHGTVTRGNSPAAATLSVADLKLTPPDRNDPAPTIALPSVKLAVRPGAPLTLDVGLPLSWNIALPSGPAFTARFTAISDRYGFDLNALLHHAADPISSSAFAASGLRIDSADTNFTLISVKSFSVAGTRNPQAGKTATALSVHENLTGLALSPIFVTLGRLPFSGRIAALSLDLKLSGPALNLPAQGLPVPAPGAIASQGAAAGQAMWQAMGPQLHQWAEAGGHGSFAVGLKIGPLDAHDSGSFSFDATSQPVMNSTLKASGVGAMLGEIATDYPQTVGIISTLTAAAEPYLTKGAGGNQHLAVDFGLGQGVLTANGKKVATVPKLVWPPASP